MLQEGSQVETTGGTHLVNILVYLEYKSAIFPCNFCKLVPNQSSNKLCLRDSQQQNTTILKSNAQLWFLNKKDTLLFTIFFPQNPVAHMNLGAMLHLQGKLKEAEMSYTRALKLRPGDQLTEENLKKLRTLQAKRKV